MVGSEHAKSVLVVHRSVPDYRVSFFDNLYQLGQEDGINYQITTDEISGHKELPQIELNNSYTRSIKVKEYIYGGRSLVKQVLPFDMDSIDLVITEHAIHNLNTYKWLFVQRPKRLALWGHGKTYTKKNTRFEEWLKTKVVNKSDWFFGYTKNGVKSVVQKGFPEECTTIVQNSTDTLGLKRLKNLITQSEIDQFKRSFMVGNGPIGVFIGELDPSKRIEFLIKSSIEIQKECPTFELLIFGSGSEIDRVLAACHDYSFIKYCGRAQLETKVLVSEIARFILMPGRIGLIAVDSLTLGLPILSTKWTWHAPEAEYLTAGVNSEFFSNSVADYSAGVLELLLDENRLTAMKRKCLESSSTYSTEIMAKNFHEGVKKLLNKPEHKLYILSRMIRNLF